MERELGGSCLVCRKEREKHSKVKTIDDFNRYKSVPWEKEAYKRGDKYKL